MVVAVRGRGVDMEKTGKMPPWKWVELMADPVARVETLAMVRPARTEGGLGKSNCSLRKKIWTCWQR